MIKTIIFDFGGVFIDLDKESISIELERLGSNAFSAKMAEQNERYEKGMISTNEFLSFYKDQFPAATDKLLINAWNSIILNLPDHRLKFIEALRSEDRFQLILLSNTNELHMKKMIENMGAVRFTRFKNSFHAFYLSHEIKMRKPDPEIFRHVLNTHNLNPKECLFIDDTVSHTIAASNLGIHTWNMDEDNQDITSLFKENNALFN